MNKIIANLEVTDHSITGDILRKTGMNYHTVVRKAYSSGGMGVSTYKD